MREMRMSKLAVTAVVTIAVVAGAYVLRGTAQDTPESQLLDEVAAALGGKARVLGVRTLVVEGGGRQGDLNALMTADSPLVGWDVGSSGHSTWRTDACGSGSRIVRCSRHASIFSRLAARGP